MTAGESALLLNEAPLVSRITAIISDTPAPEYTRLENREDYFRTFGCSGIYNSQDRLCGKVVFP